MTERPTALLLNQLDQLKNPDGRVMLAPAGAYTLLARFADGHQGLSPADALRFARCFWEVSLDEVTWVPWHSTASACMHYGGQELALFWEDGRGQLARKVAAGAAYIRGQEAWGKKGVVVSQMSIGTEN